MQGIVFFIVNESEIIFASNSEIAVNNFKNAREYEDFNETASELGKDDMLSDRDIIETSFMSGFNNGIYYIDSFINRRIRCSLSVWKIFSAKRAA